MFVMGLRGERVDGQLAMAIFAAITVGCSFAAAPLVLGFVAIISAVLAVVFQVIDIFGPDSTWATGTAPVLWALQAVLFAALAYLLWWNQHRLVSA